MKLEEFFAKGDWSLMEKAAKCKSITEFSNFIKQNNIEIDEKDFNNVYNFMCKSSALKSISEDELYMVAGGKTTNENASCNEFNPRNSDYIKEICCEACSHAKKAKGNLFMKERIVCDIGKGKGYKSPNNIFN